jgi:hypothetical protein
MALPTPWTIQDQYRAETLDRELRTALETLARAVRGSVSVKERFQALGMTAKWPTDPGDAVHQKEDAQTRQEQVDCSSLIDYLRNRLLNDGTATSLTSAQAAGILNRYAKV